MARILVLVTSPEKQEWRNDWWYNVDEVDWGVVGGNYDIETYTIGFFRVVGNSTNNDMLYAEKNASNCVGLARAQVNQGLNYLLIQSGQSLKTFLDTDLWQLTQGDDRAVILIRGNADTREVNITAVNTALENHQVCIGRHGTSGPEGEIFSRYTSDRNYYRQDMMRLRYGGRNGQETLQDRINVFENVWQSLGCGIPPKLEAYLDIMLNLAFDNKPDANGAKSKHEDDIQSTASDTEKQRWKEIKCDIDNWDENKRDEKLADLNRKFFAFAKRELEQHLSHLSDLE